MRARALVLVVLIFTAGSCRGQEAPKPTPPPDLDRPDLIAACLDQKAVGDGWVRQDNPGPNTVQIGGRVGAANVRPVRAEGTSAFDQDEGDGFVSSTILLLRSDQVASAVIPAHEEAATKTSWTQDRDDGGSAKFTINGAVQQLPSLGDAMYAARMKVAITTVDKQSSELAVEYVVFSVGPLVAFVVTQEVGAATFARRLESRVARLLTK